MPVGSAVADRRADRRRPALARPSSTAFAPRPTRAWEALGELPDADLALAVGGSAASLPRVAGEQLDPAVGSIAIADGSSSGPALDVAERYGLDPRRVRLLPAGLLILEAGVRRLRLALEVGRGGLREGVVLALMETAERRAVGRLAGSMGVREGTVQDNARGEHGDGRGS